MRGQTRKTHAEKVSRRIQTTEKQSLPPKGGSGTAPPEVCTECGHNKSDHASPKYRIYTPCEHPDCECGDYK